MKNIFYFFALILFINNNLNKASDIPPKIKFNQPPILEIEIRPSNTFASQATITNTSLSANNLPSLSSHTTSINAYRARLARENQTAPQAQNMIKNPLKVITLIPVIPYIVNNQIHYTQTANVPNIIIFSNQHTYGLIPVVAHIVNGKIQCFLHEIK